MKNQEIVYMVCVKPKIVNFRNEDHCQIGTFSSITDELMKYLPTLQAHLIDSYNEYYGGEFNVTLEYTH